jgi:hypothetical protein
MDKASLLSPVRTGGTHHHDLFAAANNGYESASWSEPLNLALGPCHPGAYVAWLNIQEGAFPRVQGGELIVLIVLIKRV